MPRCKNEYATRSASSACCRLYCDFVRPKSTTSGGVSVLNHEQLESIAAVFSRSFVQAKKLRLKGAFFRITH